MKRLVLLAVVLFALSACSSKTLSFDKALYDPATMAYVVLDVTNNASPSDYRVSNILTFKDQNGKSIEFIVDGTRSFMIAPGEYSLTNFAIYGSRSYGNMVSSVDIDFEDQVYGHFVVAAGDAAYLGHAELKITKVDKNLFKQLFNMGTSASDIEYEINISDKFESMDKQKFESESGKTLTPAIMELYKK